MKGSGCSDAADADAAVVGPVARRWPRPPPAASSFPIRSLKKKINLTSVRIYVKQIHDCFFYSHFFEGVSGARDDEATDFLGNVHAAFKLPRTEGFCLTPHRANALYVTSLNYQLNSQYEQCCNETTATFSLIGPLSVLARPGSPGSPGQSGRTLRRRSGEGPGQDCKLGQQSQ